MSDDFFIRLERQLEAAELRELKRAPALRRIVSARRLLSVPLAAAAAVGVVVVVLAVLGAIDKNDADTGSQAAAGRTAASAANSGAARLVSGRFRSHGRLVEQPITHRDSRPARGSAAS